MVDILLIITGIWLAAASFTDLKKREVANWLSFSLIAIALTVRLTESIISWNYTPLITSITGLAIFFVLANIFYYGKIFAGGDAKLLIALGAVIPGAAFLSNLLFVGSIWGLAWSFSLAITNKKAVWKEITKPKKNPSHILLFLLSALAVGIVFNLVLLNLLAAAAILLYGIHLFVRAVEKTCLIKKLPPQKLTEGDWLMKNIKVKNKTVKATVHGLTQKDLKILKKAKKLVKVKQGIPFIPVFLIAFILTIYLGNIFFLLI